MAQFLAYAAMAGTQIFGGYAQSKEDKYTASLYEAQAEAISEQKKIEAMQYQREARRVAGTTIANIGGSGLQFSGSPMKVFIDTLTQIQLDKMIGQYNLEVERRGALSTAEWYRHQAKIDRIKGLQQGFSSLLMGGIEYGSRTGMFNRQPTTIRGGRGGTKTGKQMTPYGPTETWSPYKR